MENTYRMKLYDKVSRRFDKVLKAAAKYHDAAIGLTDFEILCSFLRCAHKWSEYLFFALIQNAIVCEKPGERNPLRNLAEQMILEFNDIAKTMDLGLMTEKVRKLNMSRTILRTLRKTDWRNHPYNVTESDKHKKDLAQMLLDLKTIEEHKYEWDEIPVASCPVMQLEDGQPWFADGENLDELDLSQLIHVAGACLARMMMEVQMRMDSMAQLSLAVRYMNERMEHNKNVLFSVLNGSLKDGKEWFENHENGKKKQADTGAGGDGPEGEAGTEDIRLGEQSPVLAGQTG